MIASTEDPALIERIRTHVRQRGEEDLLLPLGARGPPPLPFAFPLIGFSPTLYLREGVSVDAGRGDPADLNLDECR